MPINKQKLLLENTRQALLRAPIPKGASMNAWASQFWQVLGWVSVDACRGAVSRLLQGNKLHQPIEYEEVSPPPEVPLSIAELQAKLRTTEKSVAKARAWAEIFETTIRDVVTPFKPVPLEITTSYIHKAAKKRLAETCHLYVSDMHTGSFIDKESVGGLSEFSREILKEEVKLWKRNFADCLAVQRSAVQVNKAIMGLLGDFPTGEDIYPKQMSEIDDLIMEQIVFSAYVLSDMARWVASLVPEVEIFGVEGNHGRTSTTTLNADYLVYLLMAHLLNDQKNITFRFTHSPFLAWSEPGVDRSWNYLISHGRDIQAWNRIPYYGLDRARAEWIDLTGIVFDSIIVGHHHRYAETQGWIMNGTWVPGTQFSVGKLRAASQAVQAMLFHNPKVGWTSRWPLYLSEKPRYVAAIPGEQKIYTPFRTLEEIQQSVNLDN